VDLIYLNAFKSRTDRHFTPNAVSWAVFCEFITDGHMLVRAKGDAPLFNAVRYRSVEELGNDRSSLARQPDGTPAVARLLKNIATVDALVLDYDGTLTIIEARERFEKYEHVGYTSYSHLIDGETHKFRIIIRLKSPIPAHRPGADAGWDTLPSAWYQYRESLHKFAGPCDPASFNANQIYFIPSVHPDNSHHAESWFNSGDALDWEQLPADHELKPASTADATAPFRGTKRSSKVLHPDDVLRTQGGLIRVGDIQGAVQGVWCPFHDDHNGTEFARRVPGSNRVFLHCRRCDQSFYMVSEHSEREATPQFSTEELQAQAQAVREDASLKDKERERRLQEIQRQLVYGVVPEAEIFDKYIDASDRAHIEAQLAEIKAAILEHESRFDPVLALNVVVQPRAHLVYMPEGAGKSRLAIDIAREGRTVVFACKSWGQAFEKYEGFREAGARHGFTARMFLSKEAKVRRRFNVKAVRAQPSDPFDSGRIDDEASIRAIAEHHPHLPLAFIRLTWNFLRQDSLYEDVFREGGHSYQETLGTEDDGEDGAPYLAKAAEENVGILVTTFAQLRTLHSRHEFIPKKWVVWFDDPDISDVLDIAPFERRRSPHWTDEDIAEHTFEISGDRYHGRPVTESLGRPYSSHICVYTTTEKITLRGIQQLVVKHGQRFELHDRMSGVSGGKITILGTEKVYARNDGVVPLMIRRLNKQEHSVRLIANGLSQGLNHSSSKGINDLSGQNIVVEISTPHPAQTKTVCDALGLGYKEEGNDIARDLMLDQMHQAIGRNSGYRFQGGESVVLVDRKHHRWLVKNSRYLVDTANSVQIDRTTTMSRRDRRTTTTASALVQDIETFLNNLDQYFDDARKVSPDIEAVMKDIQDGEKRVAYAKRLIHAIYSASGCHPKNGNGNPDDRRSAAYRRALGKLESCCQGSEWERAVTAFLADIALPPAS
jgi:hypothetical protein